MTFEYVNLCFVYVMCSDLIVSECINFYIMSLLLVLLEREIREHTKSVNIFSVGCKKSKIFIFKKRSVAKLLRMHFGVDTITVDFL